MPGEFPDVKKYNFANVIRMNPGHKPPRTKAPPRFANPDKSHPDKSPADKSHPGKSPRTKAINGCQIIQVKAEHSVAHPGFSKGGVRFQYKEENKGVCAMKQRGVWPIICKNTF